ncbi:MAG: transporter [Thermoguttaceae bacterium]|nr:transporter [Thermoguttaceae bacterium]
MHASTRACAVGWVLTIASLATAQDIGTAYGYPLHEEPPDFAAWNAAPPQSVPPGPEGDRTGLTDEASSVFAGRLQIESGYSFVYDSDGPFSSTQHYFPDLLLRYGLTDRLEIRFGWPGWQWTSIEGPALDASDSETLDPNFGIMYDLRQQDGIMPQTAVLVAIPVAFDGNPFAVAGWQLLSELMYLWRLSERTAIVGSTGFGLFSHGRDDYLQLQQSLGCDWAATDRASTFVEWETFVDYGSADDGAQHLLGGGCTYLLDDQFEIGWRTGLGLNERAPDFLTGIRFTLRL